MDLRTVRTVCIKMGHRLRTYFYPCSFLSVKIPFKNFQLLGSKTICTNKVYDLLEKMRYDRPPPL
jgi:hypothetical protein